MRPLRTLAFLAALGFLSAACSDSSGPDGGGGPPVVSRLTCEDPDTGNRVECALILENASSFEITLRTSDCDAHGTTIRLTTPLQVELTEDGCYIATGQTWDYPVTWPAGTEIRMEVVSSRFPNPASFDVTGEYPHWTLFFEDGADADQDDFVLDVRAFE